MGMACTCRRSHPWIFACMCSSRRLSLGMPRIGAACGTSTTWTSRRWCRRYQHGGTGSSSAQCRWEEVACARWHRGQCAMWMGGTDIWGRPPPRPHTAQRGVAQCVRTAGSAEPAASRPRMVMGLAVVVDMCGRLNMSMCVCVVCVWCGKEECTIKCPMSQCPNVPLSNVACPNVMSQCPNERLLRPHPTLAQVVKSCLR